MNIVLTYPTDGKQHAGRLAGYCGVALIVSSSTSCAEGEICDCTKVLSRPSLKRWQLDEINRYQVKGWYVYLVHVPVLGLGSIQIEMSGEMIPMMVSNLVAIGNGVPVCNQNK